MLPRNAPGSRRLARKRDRLVPFQHAPDSEPEGARRSAEFRLETGQKIPARAPFLAQRPRQARCRLPPLAPVTAFAVLHAERSLTGDGTG
jgi:hypothetical protein